MVQVRCLNQPSGVKRPIATESMPCVYRMLFSADVVNDGRFGDLFPLISTPAIGSYEPPTTTRRVHLHQLHDILSF